MIRINKFFTPIIILGLISNFALAAKKHRFVDIDFGKKKDVVFLNHDEDFVALDEDIENEIDFGPGYEGIHEIKKRKLKKRLKYALERALEIQDIAMLAFIYIDTRIIRRDIQQAGGLGSGTLGIYGAITSPLFATPLAPIPAICLSGGAIGGAITAKEAHSYKKIKTKAKNALEQLINEGIFDEIKALKKVKTLEQNVLLSDILKRHEIPNVERAYHLANTFRQL